MEVETERGALGGNERIGLKEREETDGRDLSKYLVIFVEKMTSYLSSAATDKNLTRGLFEGKKTKINQSIGLS